jgi:hypothetical protein
MTRGGGGRERERERERGRTGGGYCTVAWHNDGLPDVRVREVSRSSSPRKTRVIVGRPAICLRKFQFSRESERDRERMSQDPRGPDSQCVF